MVAVSKLAAGRKQAVKKLVILRFYHLCFYTIIVNRKKLI
jgi:hypothetical protein